MTKLGIAHRKKLAAAKRIANGKGRGFSLVAFRLIRKTYFTRANAKDVATEWQARMESDSFPMNKKNFGSGETKTENS